MRVGVTYNFDPIGDVRHRRIVCFLRLVVLVGKVSDWVGLVTRGEVASGWNIRNTWNSLGRFGGT